MMNKLLMLGIVAISIASCNKKTDSQNLAKAKTELIKAKQIELIEISRPVNNQMHTIGNEIELVLNKTNESVIDSMIIYFDNQFLQKFDSYKQNSILAPKVYTVGTHELKIVAFIGKEEEVERVKLRFKSDIEPDMLACKIIKTYKHDPKAYTQGLQYADGILYEGTGQYGQSSLRKVDLNTGEVKQYLSIKQQFFGEGITILNDKLIQITWNSRTGMIYDKESFKQLATFTYNTEGWGITFDGNQLIMSVGTNKLHYIDTDVYSEVKAIEVYDHKGPVNSLNELEYVDGLIYANVWQQKYIVVIDPETGKVIQQIDCSSLVPEKYKFHNDNVLNGIAYNPTNKHFYLTGKYWDVLYEVVFE